MKDKGTETLAMMRAAAKVREGRWVNGAPSHVFAEFAKQLNEDGWKLVPTQQQSPEHHLAKDGGER